MKGKGQAEARTDGQPTTQPNDKKTQRQAREKVSFVYTFYCMWKFEATRTLKKIGNKRLNKKN